MSLKKRKTPITELWPERENVRIYKMPQKKDQNQVKTIKNDSNRR